MKKTVADLANRWLLRKPETLSELENRVLQSAIDRRSVARDTNVARLAEQTYADRIADAIARVGGSWTFILSFLLFLAVWTAGNVIILGKDEFDPYPFVFLNLILSMVAALQAPVIMMSQNRQAERDRTDAAHDYEVNLKAEIEIMALHEKLDLLRHMEMTALRDKMSELSAQITRLESRFPNADTSE